MDEANKKNVTYSQNLQIENDYHLAWKVKSDLSAVNEAYATLAMIGANGNYYLRANIMSKLYGAGTWMKNDYGTHNIDVQYDMTEGKKGGLMDMPLFLRYANKQAIGPVDYRFAVLLGQNYLYKDTIDFKVSEKLKLGITSAYDLKEVLTNPKDAKIKLGAAAEFKI